MAELSQLLQVLALLYKMTNADIIEVERDLYERRRIAWRNALHDKAREYGCNKSASGPHGRDLAELRSLARQDAKSVADTWNRDVERQLDRLYTANPRGNRNYYYTNLEDWARQRDNWKLLQIALNTEQSTRFYAQDRFRQENGLKNKVGYIFVGPPPVCEICVKHFAAGVVTERYVQMNPAPVHINCPHEWQEAVHPLVVCDEMWLG